MLNAAVFAAHASVAGADGRVDVNSTFLQPFVSKALGRGRTLTLNSESTPGHWNVPIPVAYSKVTVLRTQRISFAGGARVYLDSSEGGADWGLRFVVTLLSPE